MSRLWAALPFPDPLDEGRPAPAGACWWRLLLPRNGDGHHLIIRTDARELHGGDGRPRPTTPPRLGCWEWFDGLDVQLIGGVDVFDVCLEWDRGSQYLDVLAIPIALFTTKGWANLTSPEDQDQRHPSGFGHPLHMPAMPFDYSPYVVGSPSGAALLPKPI